MSTSCEPKNDSAVGLKSVRFVEGRGATVRPPPHASTAHSSFVIRHSTLASRADFLIRVALSPILLLCLVTPAVPAVDSVIISEFMAANTKTVADEKKSFEDWIELRNLGRDPVNLAGWLLTTSPKRNRGWSFPSSNLAAGSHLLVWASGKDRRVPGAPLHTNFKLASTGEYLALVRPDGSVASEFAPRYPSQSPDVSYGYLPGVTQAVFFVAPTPGRPNESSTNLPGPRITTPGHTPAFPSSNDAVVVTAQVTPVLAAVTNVTLWWRPMFHHETNEVMRDRGDGVWTATIPPSHASDGQILRWRMTAQDASGRLSQFPLFGNTRLASRYLGTVVSPNYVTSALPVFQLFLPPARMSSADSENGTRGCFFYDGEFYDNVLVKLRGNTTAMLPKKSHRLEFPHDHALRHPGPGGRVRHTSLLAEFGDPTYLRQHLSFWLETQTGSPAPFHYPVRVQLNGDFWQLAMHSEVLGEELLARHGLDPEGALYKAVGTLTPDFDSTGGFEKKTRRNEGDEDYVALAKALSERRSADARRTSFFNLINVPATINYMAVARLTQEDDDIWANLSLYHDCDGTGEWRPIPFDMNVSWGFSFAHGGIQATEDRVRSHPFFGASKVGLHQGFNRLYDAVVSLPETREMLCRRMRTILDEWWQPPGTPLADRLIERHLMTLTNQLWADAVLDRRKWGYAWGGSQKSPEASLVVGVRDLVEQFIEPRRRHFYVTHSVTNTSRRLGITSRDNAGLPESQPTDVRLEFAEIRLCPTNAAQEYLCVTNPNPFAVDLSGWHLEGAAQWEVPPGTVIPTHSCLYLSPNVKAFRTRASTPRGGEALFVVGNYRGRLADGAIALRDERHRKVIERPARNSFP
jgi:hypothetical protein